MADKGKVFQKVIHIVSEQLHRDSVDIDMDSRFTEDLNADSLDQVELLMELEDEFKIGITDEEAQKLTTVGKAVEHILGKIE